MFDAMALSPVFSFDHSAKLPSSDGTQVFSSSCTPVEPDNCRGYALQGPSTLSALPAAGGTARTIYSSQSHAIAALHAVSSQTLLMYLGNTGAISARMASGKSTRMGAASHASPPQQDSVAPTGNMRL